MNDGKNMAGMVSEKVQACGDGFCDRAAREAVGRFSPKERAVMYGTAADTTFYERLRSDEAAGTPGTPIGLDAFLKASENKKNPLCLPGCGVETPENRCVHEFGCIVAARENRKASEETAVERAKAQARKALEQKEAATTSGNLGFLGPRGFVPYPDGCGLSFEAWSAAMVREANVDSLQAEMDRAARLGGYGSIAQQSKALGKQFTRSDILAIIRAEIARKAPTTALYNLLNIFENLE